MEMWQIEEQASKSKTLYTLFWKMRLTAHRLRFRWHERRYRKGKGNDTDFYNVLEDDRELWVEYRHLQRCGEVR